MTTYRPLRESSREGRSRLSCGSVEAQTRHWHPSVGTPIEVPEPSAPPLAEGVEEESFAVGDFRVPRSLDPGIVPDPWAERGVRLRRYRLIDLHVSQLQLAEQIQQEFFLFGSQMAFGLLVQGVEHVNEFASGFGVNHRLAGSRISVRSQDHGGILP